LITALTFENYGAVDRGIGSLASVNELNVKAAKANKDENFM